MSEEPKNNCWEIDPDHALGILKRTGEPVVNKDTGALITVAMLGLGAIASVIALIHFGGIAFSQWQMTQENSARQELADLKACLGK